jgi:hypothetical protein
MKNLIEVIQVRIMEAVTIMCGIKGHPFSYWASFTEPSLSGGKSTYNQFGGKVYKFATYTLVANRDYNRAIEIAAEKSGIDFTNWKPQPHNYADHLAGNILYHREDVNLPVEDRRLYAQFMLHKGCQIETQYFDADMRPIEFERIKPFLKVSTSKKQTDFGLEKSEQIPCINFAMGSIKQFTIGGQRYEIVAE